MGGDIAMLLYLPNKRAVSGATAVIHQIARRLADRDEMGVSQTYAPSHDRL